MRISLKVGATIYPLAGAAGVSERTHSSAADFQLTPQAEKQIAEFVRGEYAKPLDRGNLLNVLTFRTTRQFATVAAAQLWCLDYAADFPSAGTLLFDAIAPDGSVTRRQMRDTVIDPPRRSIIGATALLDYQVQGGVIEVGALAYASVTINPTGADNSILYTATIAGTVGNSISITYASNGPQSNVLVTYPLTSPVVGTPYPITITPGVGGATAAQVIAAVNDTMAPVTASAVGTVTGAVNAVTATNLTGGA